jgi:predicted DNA-binding transcriptional regulator AlpA
VKRATAPKHTQPEIEEEEPLSPELAAVAYRRSEVLHILGNIHSDTLDRWRRKGIAPPQTTLPGRQVVFFKDSFHQWLRNRESKPKAARRGAR